MALLKQWRDKAYSETANKGDLQRFWAAYFQTEKEIYAELLKNPTEEVKGSVKELAEKFDIDIVSTQFPFRFRIQYNLFLLLKFEVYHLDCI